MTKLVIVAVTYMSKKFFCLAYNHYYIFSDELGIRSLVLPEYFLVIFSFSLRSGVIIA